MKAELFCVHKHDTLRLHHLHTVSIIHQNRDALLESVFNRTPWTAKSVTTVFVVKVRVVPAQPALSCASPLTELSLRPCPSVGSSGAGQNCSPANSKTAVLYDVVCCCEMLCLDGVH